MGTKVIEGVYFFPISPIVTTGGKVIRAVKGLDIHLPKFAECYFSTARSKDPKAWKKHTEMSCNIFVPYGAVRFVFYDDRHTSPDFEKIVEFEVSELHYGRLVIHPGIWFGFSGIKDGVESIILNVASVEHDPAECLRLEPGDSKIPYQWTFKTSL
jgi:dTDP-4-dehydrorhamnose 3,5-epimerase